VSDNSREESLKKYFIGTIFDMGIFDEENPRKCIEIEFIERGKD
jgi:hypothetical protein